MIETVQPQWPAPAAIRAWCTTRVGGVSEAPFESLNLGLHVGDVDARVIENRERLQRQLKLPTEPAWIRQIHGTRVVVLGQNRGREADAAITRQTGVVAVVLVADCLPILLCNQAGTEVAAVHAGWRGLQAGVIEATLDRMQSPGDRLMAWIGPGISQPFFEVGDEVRSAFVESMPGARDYFRANNNHRWQCDLPGLAELRLNRRGIARVFRDPHCSYRDAGMFYSHRRDATTGRMAALIWIR